jgi:hypothetical protein
VPPAGNILISNLPGSPVKLHLKGARLEEVFPISTIPPDMVMNITVYSYAERMFFGMIAGYEAMPHLPEMRGYLYDAMEALEEEVRAVLEAPAERDPQAESSPGGVLAGSGATPATAPARRTPAARSGKPARKKPAARRKRSARKPAAPRT